MRVIADLHIHSKYARACSPLLTPGNLAVWAEKKGIGVLGTGDFTHPGWMRDLGSELIEAEPGLYKSINPDSRARFLYTAEIASIYKQGDKVRRVHNLVFAPSRQAAQDFNLVLEKRGANLKSDGRPIVGIHCDELVKIAKGVDENMHIVPAHAWTPHFGVFGSLSGFNSLQEAFGDEAQHIWAIETGLSSDPTMNWQVAGLDDITLISNSDPHSLHRLGREANVLNIEPGVLSYAHLMHVLKHKNPEQFLYTVEFYPEEGRYHLDGHKDCKFSCDPQRTKELGGMCPVCGKQLLRGVLYRVNELGGRPQGVRPPGSIPFRHAVSLEEIIAGVLKVGVGSKRVQGMYEQLLLHHTEFEFLLDLSISDISKLAGPAIADGVERMRTGNLHVVPGYDGLYGEISLYGPKQGLDAVLSGQQARLF